MKNVRGLILLSIPLLGIVVLAAAIAFQAPAESVPAPRRTARAGVPASQDASSIEADAPVELATEPAIAAATEEARIRATYENYRTAVATGQSELADALLPVLRRDRAVALRMAREDLARASEPLDQRVARKAVETLGR